MSRKPLKAKTPKHLPKKVRKSSAKTSNTFVLFGLDDQIYAAANDS